MNNKPCLIITSINGSDNTVLKKYGELCSEKNTGFILAGDTKSPKDFQLPGCEFLSIDTQKKLPFRLPGLLPDRNYAKKNVAYLQAIKKGYTTLIETDDDNIPMDQFWEPRMHAVTGDLAGGSEWINIYRYFTDVNIWPRGFSLNDIKSPAPELDQSNSPFFCPIQQFLADENPDVDAIYRLTQQLPVYFEKRDAVILGHNSICPFNSQNTVWFKEAFPLLYLPSYCSFRMTDIWRSFIAQRILWTCNWHLAFQSATAYQVRNEHDLIKDLEDEISGYLHNDAIVKDLRRLDLKEGEDNIMENLRACYRMLVDKNHVDKKELDLVDAWIHDLESI